MTAKRKRPHKQCGSRRRVAVLTRAPIFFLSNRLISSFTADATDRNKVQRARAVLCDEGLLALLIRNGGRIKGPAAEQLRRNCRLRGCSRCCCAPTTRAPRRCAEGKGHVRPFVARQPESYVHLSCCVHRAIDSSLCGSISPEPIAAVSYISPEPISPRPRVLPRG